MGFWPFGRDPANVELASRVITAATQSGCRVRGKLTIHFIEPQRQEDADSAADRCAALAVSMLRAAPDEGRIVGNDAQLSADLTARYPSDQARARMIELNALHVVGDPALSDELRRASSPPSAISVAPPTPPTSRPPASAAPSTSRPPPSVGPSTNRPPASMGTNRPPASVPSSHRPPMPSVNSFTPVTGLAAVPGGMKRRGSSQIRSIQSLLMPPGTSSAAMGHFVAPLVRDSAGRLLIGFLRAHDLIHVRHVTLDDNAAEMLSSLVPVSDAPPGGYETSRAGEIFRWQTALGQGHMFALQREVHMMSVYLARDAMIRAEVMPALVDAVTESLASAAFPDDAGLLADVARLPEKVGDDFADVLSATLSRAAGEADGAPSLASALGPLIAAVREDLMVAAMIIKQSSGG